MGVPAKMAMTNDETNSNLNKQGKNIFKSAIPIFNEHENQLKGKFKNLGNKDAEEEKKRNPSTTSIDGKDESKNNNATANKKDLEPISKFNEDLNQQKATFDKLKDKTTNGINADAKKRFTIS